MKNARIIILMVILFMFLVAPALAETDYKKVGDVNGIEIFLDKNSIIYYDDFIIITCKNVARDGWISDLGATLASQCYLKYALYKTAHSYKLLGVFAEAEGCTFRRDSTQVQLTEAQWLEENWEYTKKDFHNMYDYNRSYDFNKVRWTDFGTNSKILTIIYDEGMKIAGIKNNQELEDSVNTRYTEPSSSVNSANKSENFLMVIFALLVGVLGTIVFIQHKK